MTDQVEETVEQQPVEDMTNAMQPEAEEVEESEAPAEGESEEPESPEETPWEEIDYEGKRYQVPKELKEALMRHADYTNKTKEVAEQRRQFEEQRQTFQRQAQIQQQNLQAYANLAALDAQLQQYQNVDWMKFSEDDPVQAQQARWQFDQLKETRQAITADLAQREQYALQVQHQTVAKQLEQGREYLQREIKGWNQELAQEITKAGQDHYGFSEAELKSVLDPRAVKVLHDAFRYQQMMKKATKQETPKPTPVRSVKGKSGVQKDPDKMSTDEWLKWRNSQIAKG